MPLGSMAEGWRSGWLDMAGRCARSLSPCRRSSLYAAMRSDLIRLCLVVVYVGSKLRSNLHVGEVQN